MRQLPLKPSATDPATPDLPEATLQELALLSLPDEQWSEIRGRFTADGRPLIEYAADGSMIINDPQLAEFDRRMRQNRRPEE